MLIEWLNLVLILASATAGGAIGGSVVYTMGILPLERILRREREERSRQWD